MPHDATHDAADESLRYLRALGDSDRLHIVQRLRAEPMSVSDLCRALNSPMANVSHHLRLLKEAGVVSAEKRGRNVIYRLNDAIAASEAGTQILDFGCCRVEFTEGRKSSSAREASSSSSSASDQALLMLNRILAQTTPGKSKRSPRDRTTKASKTTTTPTGARAEQLEIDNASFERPSTAFFDTRVDGWVKEGDPSGTGVFRNFPDDTPLPGSRMIRNADGAQLATVAARNPGRRARGAPGLFQSLAGARYRAGASYVLTVGVGVSSVQPPTGGAADAPPTLRLALTFTDDAGRRRELVGRSVTAADVADGNDASPDRLVYFSVATTVARSAAGGANGSGHACAGRRIGVLLTTAENAASHAGHFILDDITLAVEAPRRTVRSDARGRRRA